MTETADELAELKAAAAKLRTATFRGAMTATPAVAALVAAREPLAQLLDNAAATAEGLHGIFADSDDPTEFVHPDTLAVARAILAGSQP